jgi:Rieske Fe-S protein
MAEEENRSDLSELSPGRRKFLQWLTGGFLSLWGVGFLWVVTSFLKPPHSKSSIAERVIKMGPLEDLPVGQARLVQRGREPIWVIRPDEENVVALAGVCTHMHCVLDWDGKQRTLDCPCHEGAFDLNGNVLNGPPPRGLRRYRIETRLGEIHLHVS